MAEEKQTAAVKATEATTPVKEATVSAPELPKAPEKPVLPTRLETLRERAEKLSIPYLPSDNEDALAERIKEALEGANKAAAPEALPDTEAEIRQKIYLEATALVRCRIVCMNPQKSDLNGEFFTVSNKYTGPVTRFIPFAEQPDGWHIEKCILDHLKSRTFQQVRTKKQGNQQLPDTRFVREFQIEELPPLTPEELKQLAIKQAAEAGVDLS